MINVFCGCLSLEISVKTVIGHKSAWMWANFKFCLLLTHSQKRFNVALLISTLQRTLMWAPVYRGGNWDAETWLNSNHCFPTAYWWNQQHNQSCWSQLSIFFLSPLQFMELQLFLILSCCLGNWVQVTAWGTKTVFCIFRLQVHPWIQECGRPCGLKYKSTRSLSCSLCNPVLKL